MTHQVRRAEPHEASSLARLIAVSFYLDPVSAHIFPDDTDRLIRHAAFFRPFVDLALAKGRVDVVGDFDGATLWLDVVDAPPEPDIDEIEQACGPNWERAAGLFQLFDECHPKEPHAYLPFIAVAPDCWGRGVGTALLTHRFRELDATGEAAYLEASNIRNAALYRRLGYEHHGDPIVPDGGPPLYPMWRKPATGDTTGDHRAA